jgi:hypothetical protein
MIPRPHRRHREAPGQLPLFAGPAPEVYSVEESPPESLGLSVCGVWLQGPEAAAFERARAGGELALTPDVPLGSPIEEAYRRWCAQAGVACRVREVTLAELGDGIDRGFSPGGSGGGDEEPAGGYVRDRRPHPRSGLRVECDVEECEIDGDHAIVDGVRVSCSRCGHAVEVFGTSGRSVRRGLCMLREECPEGGANYYTADEAEEG